MEANLDTNNIDATNFIQYPTSMVGQSQQGGIIFSTVNAPFYINEGETVESKLWISCQTDIKCEGQMIFVSNEKVNEVVNFSFDVFNRESVLKNMCIAEKCKKQYIIKIVVQLMFKQSLFMPKNHTPTIGIDNLWIEKYMPRNKKNDRQLLLV